MDGPRAGPSRGATVSYSSVHPLPRPGVGARCRAIVEFTAAAMEPVPTRRSNIMQVKTTVKAGMGPFTNNNG